MEQTKLALSAVMIVAVGLIGTNFVTGLEMTDQEKFNAYEDSSPIYGHMTIVHSDSGGNILAYVQTDNIVTNEAKDCMSERLFGGSDRSGCGATANNDLFDKIGLFTGETFVLEDNFASNTLIAVAGLGIQTADSVAEKTAAAGTGTSVDNGAITSIIKTFQAGLNVDQAVNGAGLFNAGGDALFAGQTFTSVTLLEDDTLKITWEITLG